jgi:osmoprotectant transport system ATP-binding protein
MIELRSVRKRFPGAPGWALAGVDFRVGEGETVALVGESGSGKSTLLKLCNRLLEPTAGTILLDRAPLADRPVTELRRAIGYVQQEGGLIPHWTVARNVGLVPRLLGWDVASRAARSRELLELMGLSPDDLADRYPGQLSGGQRQRVAVARALAARPRLVLMDEPFGALDAITRQRLQQLFLRVREGLGATVLLVTHDLDEAFLLGHRVAVMREGVIVRVAPPAELASDPGHPYVARLLALRRGGPEEVTE